MATLPSPVCANQAGRGFVVRMVSFTRLHPSITVQVHKVQWYFRPHFSFEWKSLTLAAGSQFTDIDECFDPDFPAGCDQKCHNVPGSFQCRCTEGYYTNNNINCLGEAWFFTFLLFLQSAKLQGCYRKVVEKSCYRDEDIQLLQSQWHLDLESKRAAEQTQRFSNRALFSLRAPCCIYS